MNTFPGLVHTARQAMEAVGTRSPLPDPARKRGEGAVEGELGDWG